jgi:glycosyltransferase involved in cell wall biosynthesis
VLLRRYGDRIDLIETPNQGQTGACLEGFRRQQDCEYVYFLDADDYLPDYFVERVRPHLQSRPVKLQFQLSTVSDQLKAFEALFPTYPHQYGSQQMKRDNEIIGYYRSPPTSGNVVRADVLKSLDTELLDKRGAIDGTLNLILPYLGDVVSVNEPLAFRRVHTSNLGQWSRPTTALLEKEIVAFRKTWDEARRLLSWDENPFDKQEPLYILERRMMIAALEGRLSRHALRFAGTILHTGQPLRQRLMLAGWALLLLAPHRAWQSYLVGARRSPHNRSRRLEAVVRTVLSPGRGKRSP